MLNLSHLKVVRHSFLFNDGTRVEWTPVTEDGKAHALHNVSIQFPPTMYGGDIELSQHNGPASAAASLHLLKWAIKDRRNKQ